MYNDKHINTYIHEILNYLKNSSSQVTFSELYSKLRIDIHSNGHLIKALQKNEKIKMTNNTIEYLYAYNIQTEEDLLKILNESQEGIEMVKLKDNKCNIDNIIEKCRNEEKLIILKDLDNAEVCFYNDTYCDKPDKDIIDLWTQIKIPGYQDLLRELNTVGLKSEKKEIVKRKAIPKKIKSKKYRRNIKITNTHVKGLDLSGMDDEF